MPEVIDIDQEIKKFSQSVLDEACSSVNSDSIVQGGTLNPLNAKFWGDGRATVILPSEQEQQKFMESMGNVFKNGIIPNIKPLVTKIYEYETKLIFKEYDNIVDQFSKDPKKFTDMLRKMYVNFQKRGPQFIKEIFPLWKDKINLFINAAKENNQNIRQQFDVDSLNYLENLKSQGILPGNVLEDGKFNVLNFLQFLNQITEQDFQKMFRELVVPTMKQYDEEFKKLLSCACEDPNEIINFIREVILRVKSGLPSDIDNLFKGVKDEEVFLSMLRLTPNLDKNVAELLKNKNIISAHSCFNNNSLIYDMLRALAVITIIPAVVSYFNPELKKALWGIKHIVSLNQFKNEPKMVQSFERTIEKSIDDIRRKNTATLKKGISMLVNPQSKFYTGFVNEI